MRSFKLFLGIIMLSIFTFSACNENISDPEPVSNDNKSLAKQMNTGKAQHIARVMKANNLENGAYFIEPTDFGYFLGLGKNFELECFYDSLGNITYCQILGGELAFFFGSYGNGDYWRVNPDGTVSVKLNTNQADAAYFDFTNNESYFGTGHMNTKFTGTIEEFCYEWEGETYCFTFLVQDPNATPSPSVLGYKLYWAVVGEVSYDSEFIDIGDRTEVALPDQVPSLQHVRVEVALGITALNRDGNESDMVRFSVHFDSPDQGVPAGLVRLGAEGWEAPTKASVLVDDLHFWLIRNPSIQEPGQSDDTRDYYAESHHV